MNTISAPCVRGGTDEKETGRAEGSYNHRSGGPRFAALYSSLLFVSQSKSVSFFSLPPQLNMCVERTQAGEQVPLAAPKLAEARTMGRDEWVWSHVLGIRWEARAAVV